ncbi:MAG: polysaccharide biosynthesis protein PslG [Gaiellaceae bacterium]|nr:polysaccharide biosynthesis protein PslG [Gaiellaceae bacterium]
MDYRRIAVLPLVLIIALLTTAAAAGGTQISVSSSVASGSTVSGTVAWSANVTTSGNVRRVTFSVDGVAVATATGAPYATSLDTTKLANGQHTFALVATSASGKNGTWSGTVTVSNSAPAPTKPSLSGSIAAPAGTAQVGQSLTASSGSWSGTAPLSYGYAWQRCDSTGAACAALGVTSSAYTLASADAGSTLRVVVTASNSAGATSGTSAATAVVAAAPAPAPTTYVVTSSVASGATLSGSLAWTATTTGKTTAKVEFFIDGVLKTSEALAPYVFNGDGGVLVTTTLTNGSHTLMVKATATDATTATVSSTVTVSNSTPAPAPAPSPTAFGSFVGIDAYRTTDFAPLAGLGVKNARMDNPSAATIVSARTYGIEVLPIVDYEPWADLNGGAGDKTPPFPQYYGTWAKRMVDQWRTMASPPKVFEVWNEPWLTSFWAPSPNASAYLGLVKAFATEAWSVWPTATILVSADSFGTASYPWRKTLLAADTTGFLNDPRILPTTHNYVEGRTPTQVTSNPCAWDMDRYKCAYSDFKAHGHPNPQVWITEFGWESGVVGEANQAAYTKQAYASFKSSGMVAKAYSFFLKSNDTWSYNWLRTDNTQKPVAPAVQQLIASGS